MRERDGLAIRCRVEQGFAAVGLLVFLVTLVRADWIEAVVGVAPDRGDGGLEWLLSAVPLLIALVAAALARLDRQQLRRREQIAASD